MAYDPTTIRSTLKTLLSTATEAAYVYDYRNPVIQGYPAIIFDIEDENISMLDEVNDLISITFKIWLITEIKVKGVQGAKDLLDSIAKSINVILQKRSNDTLSGTVDWMMPTYTRRDQVNTPEGNMLYQEMRLVCNIAASIL